MTTSAAISQSASRFNIAASPRHISYQPVTASSAAPRQLSAYVSAAASRPFTNPCSNRLIDSLPEEDFARWRSQLKLVTVAQGQVLAGAGASKDYVHFPLDCLLSLVYLTEEGGSTEIALIGNEGVVGIGMFTGESSGASQVVVQCGGLAYRLNANQLTEDFQRSAGVRQVMLRYLQALMAQSAQTAVCNRHHSVEQQLCRWLLSAVDRQPTQELTLTQEMIANTLGVRRAGVTEAVSHLRKLGLVQCRRGRIAVLDRARLEHRACECYGAVRREYQRLVPPARAARTYMAASEITLTLPLKDMTDPSQHRAANDYGIEQPPPAVSGSVRTPLHNVTA